MKSLDYEKLEDKFFSYLGDVEYGDLFRAVLKQGGEDFENIWNYTDDFYNAEGGAVGGLIYYADVHPFVMYWWYDIDALLTEVGITERIRPSDMAWFAWKEMLRHLEEFKEEQEGLF